MIGLFRNRPPDSLFLEHLPSGKILTYGEAATLSNSLAAFLAEHGVLRGDRVVFAVRNHWLVYPLLAACQSLGAALVPTDPELHRNEFAALLRHAEPALTVRLEPAPGAISLAQLLEALPRLAESPAVGSGDPESTALIIYTSGTTGGAKAVKLTLANLLGCAEPLRERYEITAADRFYCVLPTHHMNALMITGFLPLCAGGTILLDDILSFRNAKSYWQNLAACDATVSSLVPSIMALLLKHFPDRPEMPQLRFAFCGAAPLSAELWTEFESHFRLPVYQGYGLTETTCWVTSTIPAQRHRHDNVGLPLAGCEVHLSADGEVLLRGIMVGPGYFKDRRLSEISFTPDGFFRTGDLGELDAAGELKITGRLKDIIIRNGANISPAAIDTELAAHPGIRESRTIGMPDSLVGERVLTAFVPRSGSDVSEEALRAWLQERISRHLWPDTYAKVGGIPAGATGKIQTHALRRLLTGELAAEICAGFSQGNYLRDRSSEPDRLLATVQASLSAARPIEFLAYWGCGPRASLAAVDEQALRRLREFVDGVKRLPASPPRLTLLFTDLHADNNGIPRDRQQAYFAEIAARANELGFETAMLRDCWSQAGLTAQTITARAAAVSSEWAPRSLRDSLLARAKRHAEGDVDPAFSSRFYFLACRAESSVLAEQFPHSIFLTYNGPELDDLLPELPKLHLYSYKAGHSEKPWFTS